MFSNKPMSQRILIVILFLMALIVSGCGNDLNKKVVGIWKVDVNSIPGSKTDQEALKKLQDARIEFKADGTIYFTGTGNRTGKWFLHDHTIDLAMANLTDQAAAPSFIVSDDGLRIRMTSGMVGVDLIRA